MTPAALTFFALGSAWNLAALAFNDERSTACWWNCGACLLLSLVTHFLTHGVTP